jgi:hypothetical protein
MKNIYLTIFLLIFSYAVLNAENPPGIYASTSSTGKGYSITGEVIDKISRKPLAAATISIWKTKQYTITDSAGRFIFSDLPGGVYMISADLLGYKKYISYEIMLSIGNEYIIIELEEESIKLEQIVVRPEADPFKKIRESPLSQINIGIREIERNPGSNRDISKVISSFPGVSTVTGNSERNDILVRGGSPSENKFFLEGVEIPTINHFSTQGSTGGVTGIIDAGLLRDADFYTGSFPVNKGNALSSVLDLRFKDGDLTGNTLKFTLGASEAGINSIGHISENTGYVASARISYLQFLFKALKLPFLPQFTDAQFKVKTRFKGNQELTFIGLGSIDDMSLNNDTGGIERNEYILAFLPVIKQNVFTLGAVYRIYDKSGYWNFIISNSYLQNRNTKYLNNEAASAGNLTLSLNSTENELKFRSEKVANISGLRIISGGGIELPSYSNKTYQKIFLATPVTIDYNQKLTFVKYSLFSSANYISPDEKFSLTLALRADGNSYSSKMSNPLTTISPRLSASYKITGTIALSASAGRSYQLPPYTVMGFADNTGQFVNKDINYSGANHFAAGLEFKKGSMLQLSAETFYKGYFNLLRSINDNIPISGKSIVYGSSGNEPAASDLKGKSYGAELSARVFLKNRFNFTGTGTFFRSFYTDHETNKLKPQTWDNRIIFTSTAGYKFQNNYYAGIKFRYVGGTPYTPYDTEKSALVQSWNASGKAYYDYSLFNSRRLPSFTQLDVRIDKEFYWQNFAFKLYIDIQNLLNNKYTNPDILLSTGTVANPDAPSNEQSYIMKYIQNKSGTILPVIGISLEF